MVEANSRKRLETSSDIYGVKKQARQVTDRDSTFANEGTTCTRRT